MRQGSTDFKRHVRLELAFLLWYRQRDSGAWSLCTTTRRRGPVRPLQPPSAPRSLLLSVLEAGGLPLVSLLLERTHVAPVQKLLFLELTVFGRVLERWVVAVTRARLPSYCAFPSGVAG